MAWTKVPVDTDKKSHDAFDGTVRYSACCYIPPTPEPKIIVTGGCYVINGFPSSYVAEFLIKNIKQPKRKKQMLLKRYGHLNVYLNGIVYAIGGFSHKDLVNEQPVTLSACEKFHVNAEAFWTHISSLNEPRAFAS